MQDPVAQVRSLRLNQDGDCVLPELLGDHCEALHFVLD